MPELHISRVAVSFNVEDPTQHNEVCHSVGDRVSSILIFMIDCHCNREMEPVTLRSFFKEASEELTKLDVTGTQWTCTIELRVHSTHPILVSFSFVRREKFLTLILRYGNTKVRINANTFEDGLNQFYDYSLWRVLPPFPWSRIRNACVANRENMHISFVPPEMGVRPSSEHKEEKTRLFKLFDSLWEDPASLFKPEKWEDGDLNALFECDPNLSFSLYRGETTGWVSRWVDRKQNPDRRLDLCYQNGLLFFHTHSQNVYRYFSEMFRLRVRSYYGSDLGLVLEACLTDPVDIVSEDIDWETVAPNGTGATEFHAYIPDTLSASVVHDSMLGRIAKGEIMVAGHFRYLLRDGRELRVTYTTEIR